ncbi:DUF721 domain-containing protein [Hyphococcus sp. DH-69]|uniref:DUF721 domain-containing protein n=1 Tax=Hyphococcus formosus TaxID=3143534 RepID=UPI00398B5CAD
MQQKWTTRPARSAPPAIGRAGAGIFAQLAQKTKYMDPALAGHWPTLAGPRLASLSRPGRITGAGRVGKTLELHVPNGSAAAEVQMATDELLKRINAYLGPGSVTRIAVLQSGKRVPPTRKTAPKPAKQEDDDSPLGSALASFRAAINRRNEEN